MTFPARLRIAIWVDQARLSSADRDLLVWARSDPSIDLLALLVPLASDSVDRQATFGALLFRGVIAFETRLLRRTSRPEEAVEFDPHLLVAGSSVAVVSDTDAQRIDAFGLDLIVFVGAQMPRGGFMHAARFGTIAFESADPVHRHGLPAGFWEVFERRDATRFVLKRFGRGSLIGEDVLRGLVSTRYFFLLNRAALRAKSYHYLRSVVSGIASSRRLPPPLPSMPRFERPATFPTARQTMAYFGRFLAASIGRKLQRLARREEVWQVAFLRSSWREAALWQGKPIDNPPGHYLADPFAIRRNGADYCFVEDFDCRQERGSIAVYELGARKGRRIGIALDEPFHLSFPYLFEYDGDLFMCPESASNGDIRIYRCVDFPLQWKLEKVVMSGVSAVDTIIFRKDAKWWLFTVMDPSRSGELVSELFAFSAASPFSDAWLPHEMNPVVFDPGFARNGGFLVDGERLFRVSQRRGFVRYGKNSQINEIIELTDRTYEERCVATIEPRFRDRLLGTHHMHGVEGITVFDFLVESPASGARFSPIAGLRGAVRRWQRRLGRAAGSPAWQDRREPLSTQAGGL
jgi:hypothetical protein